MEAFPGFFGVPPGLAESSEQFDKHMVIASTGFSALHSLPLFTEPVSPVYKYERNGVVGTYTAANELASTSIKLSVPAEEPEVSEAAANYIDSLERVVAKLAAHFDELARISHKPGRRSHIGRRSAGFRRPIGGLAARRGYRGVAAVDWGGRLGNGPAAAGLRRCPPAAAVRARAIDRARRSRGRKHCSGRSAAHQVGTSARHAAANAALSGQPPAMAT